MNGQMRVVENTDTLFLAHAIIHIFMWLTFKNKNNITPQKIDENKKETSRKTPRVITTVV